MVTVIIPTYKRAKNISKTIESVLNQTYKDFEIIVVDDNNPDSQYRKEMMEIMQRYEDNEKIKYIKHNKNMNGAAARNTGIKNANGEYITFLDDDDFFLPNRLEVLTDALNKNHNYNGAYTATVLTRNGKIIGASSAKKSGNLKKELLLDEFSFGTGSNMFFRASALKAINGFDERFQRNQDIECMLRFLRMNSILGIDEVLVIKNQNDRSNEPDFYKYETIRKFFTETYMDDINELTKEEQDLYYSVTIRALISTAIQSKKYKEVVRLRKELKKYENNKKGISKRTIRDFLNFINNYIPIKWCEYFIRSIIFGKNVDKKIKRLIKEENL